MKRAFCMSLGAMMLAVPALASDVMKSADQRFADESVTEVPSFQRHVLPLMGRLGCNGRACHGSFQGQGGFRLSLFGYDFKADHDALLKGDEPRVDVESAEDSLMLQKPTLGIPHKGGKRLELASWQYRVFKKWIEAGAEPVEEDDAHFVKLEVSPAEIVHKEPGQTTQLKVFAHWSDGAVEDVTPLCRFRTNDESIAEVSEDGLVKSIGKGGTAVVAFYDNGVVPTQVMLPVSDKVGQKFPAVPTPTRIDELVVEKLRKLGIVPSELADDAEFLRRVSLDITGSLPTPQEITEFLADSSPDKRSKKVDELLERPAYAAWWTTLFCDMTGNNPQQIQIQTVGNQGATASTQWYRWIHKRIQDNVPYDEIVRGIALAVSRKPGQEYDDYAAEMGTYFLPKDDERHKDFAEHDYMPYFWVRRTLRNNSEEMALAFSHTFLGVRLQCAQCHKHPFDQWTQSDFKQFSAFFDRVRYQNNPEAQKRMQEIEKEAGLRELRNNNERQRRAQELLKEGKLLPWQEVFVTKGNNSGRGQRKSAQGSGRTITPKLLGGDEVVQQLEDPREAVFEWMTDSDNPYFARAIVNRIWAHYFGVGIIDPADDLNLANPPSNPALLDYLAAAFAEHNYDLKWLHREITSSRTYQLTWRPNDTNRHDTRNFSHAAVRRLPAEVAFDSIQLATAGTEELKKLHADPWSRAIADQRVNRQRNVGNYALRIFGQPDRLTSCDCERSHEPNLTQSLYLMNDQDLFAAMDRRDGRLSELAREMAAADREKASSSKGEVNDRERAGKPETGERRRGLSEADLKQFQQRIKRLKEEGKEDEAAQVEKKLAAAKAQLKRERTEISDKQKPNAANPEKPRREDVKEPVKPESEATRVASVDIDALIREMYLRTLSRYPSETEMSTSRQYVEAAKDPMVGVRDVLWALLNTKEFIVNH